MRTALGFFTLVACATLLLIGCGDSTGPDKDNRLDLTAEDNGTTVRMSVGEFLRISLPANPSSGNFWETDYVDVEVLQFVDTAFQTDPACEPGAVGCGGTTTMTYVATGKGQTLLSLTYRHVSGSAATDNYEVLVRVTS
jgi:predicted secreted protein